MQNDIYPRFLKTDYDILLKTSHAGGSYGKRFDTRECIYITYILLISFFKKFIPRTTGKSSDKAIPITIISPCHPQRFTKRQVSDVFMPHIEALVSFILVKHQS